MTEEEIINAGLRLYIKGMRNSADIEFEVHDKATRDYSTYMHMADRANMMLLRRLRRRPRINELEISQIKERLRLEGKL